MINSLSIHKIILAFLLFSFSFGCKSLKDPEDLGLKTPLPSTYLTSSEEKSMDTLITWDNYFKDEQLKFLIEIALVNNQENLKTLERIKLAKSLYRASRNAFLPEINGFAGASKRKFGEYTMDGVGNFDSNLSSTVPEDKRIPDPYRDFALGASFNWEIDIWSKIKNQRKAAAARFLASQDMSNWVKTSLISEIANAYYTMVGLYVEIQILEENIYLQEMAYNLSKDLKESGKENQLAVDQFEALLLNSKALMLEKQRLRKSSELYLTALTGQFQINIEGIKLNLEEYQPDILQMGLPAQLLQARPDVRMAEKELLAAKADVNAAKAAYFPSLNLYGQAGFNAFDFQKLFINPASAIFSLGSGLTAPLFNRRLIKSQNEIAKAQKNIAYLNYEETVMKAYLEIIDLANQFESFEKQKTLKATEAQVQKRATENSNTMFTVGYANYLDVLNAQTKALQSELELIDLQILKLQTHVKLYRALGGGWK
jgi:outer membrane protein, multidrug efflux system